MIFVKKKYFFLRIILKEIIIASLFIIKAIIVNPFSVYPVNPVHFLKYSAQGIFQHHFQGKKVCTILNKIQQVYRHAMRMFLFWHSMWGHFVCSGHWHN
jgi:hypothetical protein